MITTTLIDLRSDTGRQLLNKIAGKHRCPAYVLAASEEDMSTPEPGNETKFAAYNPVASLPHWSPAATWLSYAYLQEQRQQIPQHEYVKIAGRLRTAADAWGIVDDLDAIDNAEVQLVKESHETDLKYPIRNDAEAAAARDFLLEQLVLSHGERTINCEDRIKLAEQLVDRGYKDELLLRASCRVGCYDARKVASMFREAAASRKTTSGSDTQTDLLTAAADIIAGLSPSELQQRQAKIAVYADDVRLFDQPAELALSVNTVDPVVVLSNGAVVKVAQLQVMPDEIYNLFHATTGEVSLGRKTAAWATLASKVPTAVANEFVSHMESLGYRCEVSGIASYTGSVIDAAKLFATAEQS